MELSRITAGLSAAALATVLAGCGTTGTTTGASASGTTTATSTATAGASVSAVLADNQESHATGADLTYGEPTWST